MIVANQNRLRDLCISSGYHPFMAGNLILACNIIEVLAGAVDECWVGDIADPDHREIMNDAAEWCQTVERFLIHENIAKEVE
tara:strand:- start:143 stop:388 length:246 start_codon:yes stop_codon:yes gene_type:complete